MNPHLNPHLSEDELIELVYGLGDAEKKDERHLADCSACGERLKAMDQARVATVDVPQISGRKLAVQRLQILERLERPAVSFAWRWVPVATAASVLAAAMVLHQRPSVPQQSPSAPVAVNAEADAQLFTDVYSMEQDVEPKAVAPIRALFEEASFEEGHQ